MKKDSLILWDDFKISLVSSFNDFKIEDLDFAWTSNYNRTRFYKEKLFFSIAERMKLFYDNKEYLTIDAILYEKSSSGYKIPIVCIESENYLNDDTEIEVYKLCVINSPLKVLFLCTEWKVEKKNVFTIDFWDYIIKSFVEVNKLEGVFGIIVAEWLDKLKFYSLYYDNSGVMVDEGLLIEYF